jgi:signal transduction histidine kinase
MTDREKRLIAELEKSNRVLAEFASFAAHDLQAPVNRIAKFSDLLAADLRSGATERALHHVASIQTQAEQMSALIRDMLRLGRVAAAPDDIEDVALSSVMAEVLENLDEQISATAAHFQFGSLPVVKGHRSQLRQLFINLIDNAIRYRKRHESPFIRVDARPCPIGVEILVCDNGVGFEPRQAEEIFKPFRRLEDSPEPGTGLGLSICRRIIEALGGSIRAESQPGVGTTFTVQFPAPVSAAEEKVDR